MDVWEKYVSDLKNGATAEMQTALSMIRNGGTIQDQQIDNDKILTIKILERTKRPVMNWEAFELVKTVTLSAIESEVKEVGAQIEQGILPSKLILENRIGKALELIDFDLLQWIAKPQPLLQSHQMEAFSTLAEVGIYQWVLQELAKEGTEYEKKVRSTREQWSLPFKICLLQELGFFDLQKVRTLGFTPGKRNELVSMLLDADFTNTKKQINALTDPKGGRNPKKYTSEVKAYLKEVLGDFEKLG